MNSDTMCFYVNRDKNSSSNMKIDTLSFMNCLLIHHDPVVFHGHVKVLVPVSIIIYPVFTFVSCSPSVVNSWCDAPLPLSQENRHKANFNDYSMFLFPRETMHPNKQYMHSNIVVKILI